MTDKAPFARCRTCPATSPVTETIHNGKPSWVLEPAWTWKDGAGPQCPKCHGKNGGTLKAPIPVTAVANKSLEPTLDYGMACLVCGSVRMQRTGSCLRCMDCGTGTGCG